MMQQLLNVTLSRLSTEREPMRVWLYAFIFGLIPVVAWADEPSPSFSNDRFEKKVRPLLAERCWQCHSANKSKGGLRLDSAEALARGGDTGPSVVPGKPEESLLIEAVRYQTDLKMPPKGKLADAEMLELTEWVKAGAPWPAVESPGPSTASPAKPTMPPLNEPFWAFQIPTDPTPPAVKSADWPRSPIDRFILASLEKKGLAPALPADKRALIRRATYDLIGLPPSPEEVQAFLDDPSPEAFGRVVDRLLTSPRYGERWGRHWLDLARYADSNGMDENMAQANAFRYRDYVIKAFNADRPYDQFLKEQIAGDLLPSSDDESVNNDRLTATGFLVLGPKMLAEDDPMKMEMDIIDEQVDTVGRVFMGLTIGCARCHDHKFDPIPTADYYGMAGIFKSTRTMQNHKVVAMWNERSIPTRVETEAVETHKKEVARQRDELNKKVEQACVSIRQGARDVMAQASEAWKVGLRQAVLSRCLSLVPGGAAERTASRFSTLKTLYEIKLDRESLARFEKAAPPIPKTMAVEDRTPTHLRVHLRGNHLTLGDEVPRRFPQALGGERGTVAELARSGRLELAEWLVRRDHPLTARVMVNRIWLGHFGEGILRSPDNFGHLGDRPDLPELLDWLATRFVNSGWSIKAMHRLIMLSSTYQMGTKHNPEAALADPDNRLLWHFARRRLEAEAIRDAILSVSGEFDPTMAGTLLPTKNHSYVNNTGNGGDLNYNVNRRSVYLPVIRSGLYDVFQAFDFADPSASNGKRIPTTVAPQALFMLNDNLVLRCSGAMAKRLLAQTDLDDPGRIRRAYQAAYGRPPLDREVERAENYLRRFNTELEARGVAAEARPARVWQAYCQAIFASSEFLYLD
jgi:Protein of unknown function (DUF1549)/Protein of unknown function (DUF1553)/Planctomycete cytochrome C